MKINWKDTHLSKDCTYHEREGVPFYENRFAVAGKFHAPGLAPVTDKSGAYHIDVYGKAAYPCRFLRTFGFYEGFAAVCSKEGWFHIDPKGECLYREKFHWCGNFQNGRVPVRFDKGYTHLRADGSKAYDRLWSYAGDFRDGWGVVQDMDGLHYHINPDGELKSGKGYLDLDVFHKGYARARDEKGWFHVDNQGAPAYDARFAMVEPFYNGQARVGLESGELRVIDENGCTVTVVREPFAGRYNVSNQ